MMCPRVGGVCLKVQPKACTCIILHNIIIVVNGMIKYIIEDNLNLKRKVNKTYLKKIYKQKLKNQQSNITKT